MSYWIIKTGKAYALASLSESQGSAISFYRNYYGPLADPSAKVVEIKIQEVKGKKK